MDASPWVFPEGLIDLRGRFHLIGAVINHRYNVYADLISRASDLICRRPADHHISLTLGRADEDSIFVACTYVCYNGMRV